MSTLCPYRIIKGDDGLSVKVEWDVHYLTDEQIGIVRKYVAEIEAENAELRELVSELANDPDAWDYDYFKRRLRELGIEVDE
jgi:hypothetical protein